MSIFYPKLKLINQKYEFIDKKVDKRGKQD